jgi:hypothetical protein
MLGFSDLFPLTVHRPLFTVISVAVISNFVLFSPCSAIKAVPAAGVVQQGKSARPERPASPAASAHSETVERTVVSIVVSSIEEGAIYSKDGRKFEITGSTKVIDNSRSHRAARSKTAELFFENGGLVSVILK